MYSSPDNRFSSNADSGLQSLEHTTVGYEITLSYNKLFRNFVLDGGQPSLCSGLQIIQTGTALM